MGESVAERGNAKEGGFWGMKDTCSAQEELEDQFGCDVSSGRVMGGDVREGLVRQTYRP